MSRIAASKSALRASFSSRGRVLACRAFSSSGKQMTVRDALNSAIDEEMSVDPSVFVMGEEVGEYQGAYKITRGFLKSMVQSGSLIHPSLRLDLLAIDHIINSAAKSNYMSSGQINVPFVFRGPNGAAAGVSSQHSQCYAAWFGACPGLKVTVEHICFH